MEIVRGGDDEGGGEAEHAHGPGVFFGAGARGGGWVDGVDHGGVVDVNFVGADADDGALGSRGLVSRYEVGLGD